MAIVPYKVDYLRNLRRKGQSVSKIQVTNLSTGVENDVIEEEDITGA